MPFFYLKEISDDSRNAATCWANFYSFIGIKLQNRKSIFLAKSITLWGFIDSQSEIYILAMYFVIDKGETLFIKN